MPTPQPHTPTNAACSAASLHAAVQQHFGHAAFKEGQAAAIQAVLAGSDVVLVMPTGSGKSLCYQLAALLLPGTTLVISPLIALMKDQVDALERRGIAATFLNSSLDAGEMTFRLEGVRAGRFKLVYVAPERFRNRRFVDALAEAKVSLLAVDEAHCISQWGHDFRPDYLAMGQVVERMAGVRVLAVTATATPEVRGDIVKQLGLGLPPRQPPVIHVHGFERPNLYLSVTRTARHAHKLAQLLRVIAAHRTGIVYCSTRKMAERVHGMLREEKLSPLLYHGALSDDERSRAQDAFLATDAPVIVATNAFGMGVDRRDLRFVVHWDIPGSVEAYYQEVGRAGRDGLPAWCELLFNYVDIRTQQFFLDGANPEPRDVLAVWEAVRRACANGAVRQAGEAWAEAAGVKNEMVVRTALAMLERAGLIAREVEGGQRAYTTKLVPGADPAALRPQFVNLTAKRARDQRKLDAMLQFVDHSGCRQGYILSYFGERDAQARCAACDRCVRRTLAPRRDLTGVQWTAIQKVLSCVSRMQGRYGGGRVAQVLRGEDDPLLRERELDKLSTYGLMRDWPSPAIRALLDALIAEGCVSVTADAYHTVSITPAGVQVARRQVAFAMAWPSGCPETPDAGKEPTRPVPRQTDAAAPTGGGRASAVGNEAATAELLALLRQWRTEEARQLGVPAYRVLTNRTLEALAQGAPQSMVDLEEIHGLGPILRARYGEKVLSLLANGRRQTPGA
ncbi:MAG: ATP-dependent DNA helicase RecQ [bacterium]